MKPRLLDLFACAGGASRGYQLAGFHVTGVDIAPQPHHAGDAFVQADAIEYLLAHGSEFDAIHASPPCQDFSNLNAYNHKSYPRLIGPVREAMPAGVPFVIENVEAAAGELKDPVTLCGPMFGLRVYRHRLFETNWPLVTPDHAPHVALCARNGYLPTPERPFMSIHGGKHSRAWQNAAADAMGMPWVKVPPGGDVRLGIREVCEAIPPRYARWVGTCLLEYLAGRGRPVQLALDLGRAA